jgi:non-heme Fe2+,alpha-ketoglutarate-dependent halogenase
MVSFALNAEQVASYQHDGIAQPLDVLSASEAQCLHALYQAQSAHIKGRTNQKPHLLYTWLDALVRDARILDAVESLLGPDILCWSSQFFSKPAGDSAYVSWHQDATYWGLSSHDVLTAWVALTPSTELSGCMQVVKGTHHQQVSHADRFDESNMLSRGQEIQVQVQASTVTPVVLQPGQMSLHHVLLFHGSQPNRADWPRVGYAIRYIPTHLQQRSPLRDSALLVRGVDRFQHFDAERSPQADLDAAALDCHHQAIERQLRILYAGAQGRGKLNPNQASPTAD